MLWCSRNAISEVKSKFQTQIFNHITDWITLADYSNIKVTQKFFCACHLVTTFSVNLHWPFITFVHGLKLQLAIICWRNNILQECKVYKIICDRGVKSAMDQYKTETMLDEEASEVKWNIYCGPVLQFIDDTFALCSVLAVTRSCFKSYLS